jgi:tetratricopeptide (TPR) repeat protein
LLETPLPRLLVRLHRDGFCGRLSVSRQSVERHFEWRAGRPVSVESRIPNESLCEILARDRSIERGLGARVGETVRSRGCTELQALASLGAVAPRALVLALAEQLRSTLLACLRGRSGDYRLEPHDAVRAAPALPFDLLSVLLEGVSAVWHTHEILVELGERATRYPTLASGFESAWLPREGPVRELLAQLDGQSPTFAVLQRLAAPECAAAFWLLDELGALTHADQPMPAEAEEPASATGPRIEILVQAQPARSAASVEPDPRTGSGAAAGARSKAEALRREILDLHARLRELPLWGLLGVGRDANPAELRRAYLSAAKRLHPDRVGQLGLLDLKEAANEVFAEIARAHEVLCDPEQRKRYLETAGDASLDDADRIAEAEASFVRGDHLMRAGNFRGALEYLERAVALWPNEADYQAALGWALHRKEPSESERGFSYLERALALGTEKAVWWLRASVVARELGRAERAVELATRARALDPDVKA